MLGAGAWVYPWNKGSLHKWRVFYRLEPHGPLHTKVKATKAEAMRLAEEMKALISTSRRTVGDAIDAYIKDMEVRALRDKTRVETGRNLRRMLADVLDAPLAALTPRRADALYQAVAESGMAVGSHHTFLKHAKAFCAFCAHPRRRWLKDNPFANVDKIGTPTDHRSESLRVDEARAFRAKALALANGGDLGAVAALLALECSLRSSEIVQIEARDVDDGGAILHVAGARLKTANTRRRMEVADEEMRALLAGLKAGKAPDERIIPRNRGFVAIAAERIAKAAGVPSVNARELRRTFASLAVRSGRSLDDAAFSMGHGSDGQGRVMLKHYADHGAKETGAARRNLGVLDGGKALKK